MKRTLIGAALMLALALPVQARNYAVPEKNPAATLTIPDSWNTEEIEYGYNAFSPGKDVYFAVEYTSAKKIDAMMKNNQQWMKENEIDGSVTPQKADIKINGIDATVFSFDTKDLNGKTTVEFILMSGGDNRVIMLTLWGSDEDRAKHAKDIAAIMNSVKPIQ